MNEFKYQFVNFLLLVVLGGGIYWAFSTIDNGIMYDRDAVIGGGMQGKQVQDEKPVLFDNTIPVNGVSDDVKETDVQEGVQAESQEENTQKGKEQKQLSDEEKFVLTKLQGLIDDNIYMKKGSHGTRVGTVQKFLNIYFKTNKSVDNDYGPSTFSDVKKFQEAEGLDNDGLAGPATYKKMIEVLKK